MFHLLVMDEFFHVTNEFTHWSKWIYPFEANEFTHMKLDMVYTVSRLWAWNLRNFLVDFNTSYFWKIVCEIWKHLGQVLIY